MSTQGQSTWNPGSNQIMIGIPAASEGDTKAGFATVTIRNVFGGSNSANTATNIAGNSISGSQNWASINQQSFVLQGNLSTGAAVAETIFSTNFNAQGAGTTATSPTMTGNNSASATYTFSSSTTGVQTQIMVVVTASGGGGV